jgi:hypothetical protein
MAAEHEYAYTYRAAVHAGRVWRVLERPTRLEPVSGERSEPSSWWLVYSPPLAQRERLTVPPAREVFHERRTLLQPLNRPTYFSLA